MCTRLNECLMNIWAKVWRHLTVTQAPILQTMGINRVGPLTDTLLGGFPQDFECVCENLYPVSQKKIHEVGSWRWMSEPASQSALQFLLKGVHWGLRSVLCSSTPNSPNHVCMDLALCNSKAGRENGLSQTVATELKVPNWLKCVS